MSKTRDLSFAAGFEDRLASEARALGLVDIPLLVAVSGGPDSLALSVALGRLREKLGLTLTLVYIDHRLRGSRASRAERRAVARIAHRVQVPLRIVDTGSELLNANSGGEGLEARARHVRYRELFKIAEERGARGVCLAHHLNDQVETVLMRLVSGSTVEGLAAMRPVTERARHTVYRPMLRMERADILKYVRALSILPVYDRSNRDKRRLRSRIRTDLVPALKRTRAGSLQAIGRTADAMSEADYAITWCFEHTVGRPDTGETKNGLPESTNEGVEFASPGIGISRERFFSLPPEFRLRFLQQAVHQVSGSVDYRIPRRFFSPLMGKDAAHGEGRYAVGYGVELVVDRAGVFASPLNVTSREKGSGVQAIDHNGDVLRSTLPEPFAGLKLAVTEPAENEPAGESPEEKTETQNRRTQTGEHAVPETNDSVSVCIRPPVYLRPAIPNDGNAFAETRSGFKRRIERHPSLWAIVEDAEGPVMLLYAAVQSEVHYRFARGRRGSSSSASTGNEPKRYDEQTSALEPPILLESSGVDEPQASPLHLSIYASSDLSVVELK